MKKEGIQTRNRKLSSKSKKKKSGGCLGLGGVMGDMIKASGHLDLDNKPFHSGFGSPMGKSSFLAKLQSTLRLCFNKSLYAVITKKTTRLLNVERTKTFCSK